MFNYIHTVRIDGTVVKGYNFVNEYRLNHSHCILPPIRLNEQTTKETKV